MSDVQTCSSCDRQRTAQDTIDYHPLQVFTDGPFGWYSGDDGELCPECFMAMMRKANG